ncbi:hypothetical protein ACFO0O_06470 [Cobetia amphilecti]|uniref:Uncharacterized protein n=1 Tax=Cobetia amphilecti TaxID=1055104 RepID=A0ABT6UWW7_9GAMM|nr:hypothetical protein [Cobetia amphilecti]KGA02106.1 hypothetical protein KP05_08895 [Cobetia amphilecti]MBR9754182.1 hypothetical protein [Gammaproteobacteria bacterium]MDI5885992.1 hypothetical protein [Cobetia amphilecti]
MDEMTILSVNAHHDLQDHTPLALTTSAEGFTLLLAKTQSETYLVIVQFLGQTVSTLELASARYADFVIQLIDEHIRRHPGIQGTDLDMHIRLKAKDHLPRTPLPSNFLAPAA